MYNQPTTGISGWVYMILGLLALFGAAGKRIKAKGQKLLKK